MWSFRKKSKLLALIELVENKTIKIDKDSIVAAQDFVDSFEVISKKYNINDLKLSVVRLLINYRKNNLEKVKEEFINFKLLLKNLKTKLK